MSRLNMVRKIKDSKKENNKRQDEREKGWNERFIYNKLEDNYPDKKPIPKKNDYTSNINYLREQFNNEKINQRKSNKKRGKSGYKFNSDSHNKNKIIIKNNDILKFNNFGDINNSDDNNNNDILSLIGEKKMGIIGNNYNIINKRNNYTNFISNNNNYLNSNNASNIYYNMSLSEVDIYVGILWNKLGVKDIYQKIFNELKEEKKNEEGKKEFMILEIRNLEKIDNFLKELSSQIENRDKTILLLKKLIEVMEKQFISINLDIKESIINDFCKAITAYRINTIKVVEGIELYNQLFSYNINKGKFNEEYLIRKFKLFDKENDNKNYLLKIKNDLNFLGDSKLNGYKQLNLNFQTSNDPFLLSVLEQIPFNLEDYYERIKQCQYIIMQEVIFDSMNSKIDTKNKNCEVNILDSVDENSKKNELGPIINNNNNNKILNDNNHHIIKNGNVNRINNNNDDRKKKENNKAKKNEKIVIETQLIDKNNYENFFGNKNSIEDSDDQILEKLKSELNAFNAFNKYKKENSKIQIDSTNNNINHKLNDNNNVKVDINKLNQEEKTKKNEDIENNNKNVDILDKKEIEVKIDIYKNKDSKKLSDDIEVIKEDIKNEEKAENKNIGKIKDKDNNDDFVNLDENININKEQNQINYNKCNKDNNIEENMLKNSLVIPKKINPTKEHSRSSTPKSLHNSKIITTKEINQNQKNTLNKDNNISEYTNEIIIQSNRDNDYIAFYCGKLSNFISIYSSYYNTIPEEQKVIFNLKSDPLEYIHNNFFPKIIIYSDKKTRTIKGLCIFSFIFTNDSKNNGIYIEHISSYNEEEKEKIFEKFLSYIKENSYNLLGFENNKKDKNIYIDFYYKNEDGKFKINNDIIDYFRNQLKFKWVKLENLSKYIRYQKMRHQFMINNGNNNINLLNEFDDNNILNQSILGRKEFNDEEKINENEDEEESEDDEINTDISRIFDNDKESNDNAFNDKDVNNIHSHNKFNLLNIFSIKNKTVLKFNKKSYNNKNNNKKKRLTYIKYSNPFNFIYLLKIINDNIIYNKISPNIEYYFNKKDSNIINSILPKCLNIENILKEDNFYYSDIKELINAKNKNKNRFKVNSNINILPIFESCISFKYKNYYYNRVQLKKVQILIEAETQQTLYMISKTDNHILLISSSLNEKFKQKYINKENKDNLSIDFISIYNNLIDIDNKDKERTILYIPAFEIKSKLVNNCYCNTNDETYNLNCFEDYYNVKYFTEELMAVKNIKNVKRNKNYNGNASMNFEYDLIKEIDINKQNFISDSFLLVVLNLNIIEDLRSLPLLTLYVTKDNFISA